MTSRNSAADELRALSLGGDDYITKPYSIPILLARIKAVLRRSGGPSEPDILEAGGVRLSLSRGTVWASGRTAELTRNELKILAHLMAHAGEIVSRADLIEALWDSRIYIDDNTLSVNVTRLRNKLGELRLPEPDQDPAGEWGISMTIADFLSDRLGRIVLQGGCAAAAALFLLATGTQPGVVALLLMGLILVFVLAQLWECVRLRRRLAELKAIMEGLDQKQLFAECAPKPEGLWERELFALMHQSGQAMVGAVSEAQAAQREYREYVEQWVHEIKTPITAAD